LRRPFFAVGTAVARRASIGQHEFVALWSTAMWLLAVVYLLATFQVY
jgi:hypothetical protein